VPEVLTAYNADGLGVTGKGQTIAILIDTFPADADLTTFWQRNNPPNSLAQIAKISGGNQASSVLIVVEVNLVTSKRNCVVPRNRVCVVDRDTFA